MASIQYKKTAKGENIAYLVYRHDGKPKWKKIVSTLYPQEVLKKWEDCIQAGADPHIMRKNWDQCEDAGIDADTMFKNWDKYVVSPGNKLKNPTITQLIEQFYLLHAQNVKHQNGTFSSVKGFIENHIIPHIGHIGVREFDVKAYDEFINLLKRKVKKSYRNGVPVIPDPILNVRSKKDCLSGSTIKKIIHFMNLALKYAYVWEYIERIPSCTIDVSEKKAAIPIWEKDELLIALSRLSRENPLLYLAVHLAFVETTRSGETLSLTIDNIDLKEEVIYIDKTLQRVTFESMEKLGDEDIFFVFPPKVKGTKSTLVFKKPKSDTSIRHLFLTEVLTDAIKLRLEEIEKNKDLLGSSYNDYGLLLCHENGDPIEVKLINYWFTDWVKKQGDLTYITFHGLRHSSVTYKLLVSNGDLKSVQGDTGHADGRLIMNTYSKIKDTPRKHMMKKVNDDLYQKKDTDTNMDPEDVAEQKPHDSMFDIISIIQKDPNLLKELLAKAITA